jgi:gas vesicle protein
MADQCSLCNKSGRTDNIIRHISTHKKDISKLMTPNNIKHCINNKLPILFVPNKIIYCLICHKYARQNTKDFIDTYSYCHKKCIGKFESVNKYYHVIESTPNLFETVEPEKTTEQQPQNIIVDNSEMETMRSRIQELERANAKLLETQRAVEPTNIDFKEKYNDLNNDYEELMTDTLKYKKYMDLGQDMCEAIERLVRELQDRISYDDSTCDLTLQVANQLIQKYDSIGYNETDN